MKWRERISVLAVLIALSGFPLAAQERLSTPDYRKVNDSLMCQCGGCSATVSNCAMEHCHSAEPIREEVADRIQKGETPDSIVKVFTDRYGLAILSAPPIEGFHLTAWLAPFVVLVVGFFITRHVLRSWRQQTVPASVGAQVVPLSDAQRARIEKELRELSS
ncbi:MAG: cytochrome c-type biogenesis protein [Vicinamibacteria bacterium]